jgi:hypothetical protein
MIWLYGILIVLAVLYVVGAVILFAVMVRQHWHGTGREAVFISLRMALRWPAYMWFALNLMGILKDSYFVLLLPFAAMTAVLAAMGRPWWCGCGGWELYIVSSPHYSQHLFDSWSFSHFAQGGAYYAAVRGFTLQRSRLFALVGSLVPGIVWEFAENSRWIIGAYRDSGARWYDGDTIANANGDLLSCLLGALVMCLILKTAKGSRA